jgi:hypothetical protein
VARYLYSEAIFDKNVYDIPRAEEFKQDWSIIRRALQLYEFVIEEEEKGGGVTVKTIEDGETTYRSIF